MELLDLISQADYREEQHTTSACRITDYFFFLFRSKAITVRQTKYALWDTLSCGRDVLIWAIVCTPQCACLCIRLQCFNLITLMPLGVHLSHGGVCWCIADKDFGGINTSWRHTILRLFQYLHFSNREGINDWEISYQGVALILPSCWVFHS